MRRRWGRPRAITAEASSRRAASGCAADPLRWQHECACPATDGRRPQVTELTHGPDDIAPRMLGVAPEMPTLPPVPTAARPSSRTLSYSPPPGCGLASKMHPTHSNPDFGEAGVGGRVELNGVVVYEVFVAPGGASGVGVRLSADDWERVLPLPRPAGPRRGAGRGGTSCSPRQRRSRRWSGRGSCPHGVSRRGLTLGGVMGDRAWQVPQEQFIAAWNGATTCWPGTSSAWASTA